jgi:hypothetical protein
MEHTMMNGAKSVVLESGKKRWLSICTTNSKDPTTYLQHCDEI